MIYSISMSHFRKTTSVFWWEKPQPCGVYCVAQRGASVGLGYHTVRCGFCPVGGMWKLLWSLGRL